MPTERSVYVRVFFPLLWRQLVCPTEKDLVVPVLARTMPKFPFFSGEMCGPEGVQIVTDQGPGVSASWYRALREGHVSWGQGRVLRLGEARLERWLRG